MTELFVTGLKCMYQLGTNNNEKIRKHHRVGVDQRIGCIPFTK